MVEDIQNKIRNKLSAIKIMHDVCKIMTIEDPNSDLAIRTVDYIKKSNLCKIVQQSIQDLIDIGLECDKKINDPNYDIWNEVIKNRK